MNTLIIKTCAKDFAFLIHCLGSIRMNVVNLAEFNVKILCDPMIGESSKEKSIENWECWNALKKRYPLFTFEINDLYHDSGYINQQIVKIVEGLNCQTEWIGYLDCDCIVYRRMIFEPKPIVYGVPWDEAGDAKAWREPTKKMLGFDPLYETMQRWPFWYPSSLFQSLKNSFWFPFSGGLIERLKNLDQMSEFNLLGNFWLQCECHVIPEFIYAKAVKSPPIRQFWTGEEMTGKINHEIQQLLNPV